MVTLRSGAHAGGNDGQIKLEDMASVDARQPEADRDGITQKRSRPSNSRADHETPSSKKRKETQSSDGVKSERTDAEDETDQQRRRREADEYDQKQAHERKRPSSNDNEKPGDSSGVHNPSDAADEPVKTLKQFDDTDAKAKVPTDVSDLATKSVEINRAPVLELFGAAVASVVYPELPWRTCLSCGAWIASVCALAKGRSLGIYTTKDRRHGEGVSASEQKRRDEEETVVKVMQFYVPLIEKTVAGGEKVKLAVLHSTSHPNEAKAHGTKSGDESHLVSKFGGEDKYDDAKQAFKLACATWRTEKDSDPSLEEFQEAAFGKYEHFRPTVHGWGGRGTLDFAKVYEVVAKPNLA